MDNYTKVLDTLKFAAKHGYKAYEVVGHNTFGYLITPSDNILTVNKGTWGGLSITFDYVPSRTNGSGCNCMDKFIASIDSIEQLKEIEKAGKEFAFKLGAKRYKNSVQWYKDNYWQKQGLLKEIISGPEYKLTQEGKKRVKDFILELKAKRKEILDAKKDTAKETKIPTLKDVTADINFSGLMDCGPDGLEYLNGWGVTDHYDADLPLCLKLGRDIVEV